MRKLLMLAVVAVAAFAVVAAPASAQYRLSPNPSFPHGDFDPENWAAVDASNSQTGTSCFSFAGNCVLGGEGDAWGLYYTTSYGTVSDGSCIEDFEGLIDEDGSLAVTDGPGYHCSPYGGGGPWPENYAWDAETCLNTATGETWVRLWAEVGTGTHSGSVHYDGEVFGRVVDGSRIEFDGTVNLQTAGWAHFEVVAEMPFAQEVTFAGRLDENQEEYVPCSWPELQS